RGEDVICDGEESADLGAGRGREVRCICRQPGGDTVGGGDSAAFRFRVSGAGDQELVEQRLAIKPAFRPRAWTIAGVLTDTASASFTLRSEEHTSDSSHVKISYA